MLERVFKSWSVAQPNKDATKHKKNQQLLPNQISGRILDLQMQCDKQTISKNVVFQLLAQYTKAVQFYQEQGNQKYKLYQKRMHNFLAKPMIQSILKGQSGEMVIKKQRNQQTIRKAQNKAEQEVKQLLLKQQQKQKKNDHIIKQQLSKQEGILQQRIRKKRAMSNKSMCSQPDDPKGNNEQSNKKEKMNAKILLLDSIDQRSHKSRKVFM